LEWLKRDASGRLDSCVQGRAASSGPFQSSLLMEGLMQLEDDEEFVAEIMPLLEIDHQHV
jgi:hypothetical protein